MSQKHKGNIPEISLQMEKPREQQKKHNQIETSEHESLDLNDDRIKQSNENLQDFIRRSHEFQRQIIKEIFMIKCIVKENREVLDTLIKKEVYIHPEDNSVNKNLTQNLMKKFPLRFSEDLLDLEQQLENEAMLDAMAKELALIGGEGVKEMVLKLMYYIMSNHFASFYSWEGQKGKKVFKTLKLATLIIRTVRVRHAMATETDIVSKIKSWLVQAKFRENLKIKRSEQKALMSIADGT